MNQKPLYVTETEQTVLNLVLGYTVKR